MQAIYARPYTRTSDGDYRLLFIVNKYSICALVDVGAKIVLVHIVYKYMVHM